MKLLLVYLLFTVMVYTQSRTNLEIFYTMADSAADQIFEIVKADGSNEKESTVFFEAGQQTSLFMNRLIPELQRRNFKSATVSEANIVLLIESTSVNYGEMFRDGFFGSFFIPRELKMRGNYNIRESNIFKEFSFSYSDTVSVDSITQIENEYYPFTKGEIPSEPFFSTILEPVIAIGTTAMAVVLFFTIRSK